MSRCSTRVFWLEQGQVLICHQTVDPGAGNIPKDVPKNAHTSAPPVPYNFTCGLLHTSLEGLSHTDCVDDEQEQDGSDRLAKVDLVC